MAQCLREQRCKRLVPTLLLPFLFVVSACSATDEIKATFIPTSRNLTSAEVIADSESKLEAASGFEFSNGKLGIDPDSDPNSRYWGGC